MSKSKGIHPAAVYGAWFLSTALTFFVLFQFRDTLLHLLAHLGMNQYVLSFVDKVVLLILGVSALAIIVLLESKYRKNVSYLFPKTMGIEMLILSGLMLTRVFLGVGGPALWLDFAIWGICGGALVFIGVRRQKNQPPPQRTKHLESRN